MSYCIFQRARGAEIAYAWTRRCFCIPAFAVWCRDRVIPCQIDRPQIAGKRYGNLWTEFAVTSYQTVILWDPVKKAALGRIGYRAGGAES